MKLARNTLVLGVISLGIVFSVAFSNNNFPRNSSIDINSALDKQNIVPIVVIGSGQAGLGAALYGARFNRHTVVIEGDKPGGLLTETTQIENWPGERSIDAKQLVHAMRDHAREMGASFLTDTVVRVELDRWPFVVHTQKGDTINALSVIVATGAEPRKLGVPGEDIYFGVGGISTCAKCDAFFCKNKKVVVVGGGDSAIEEAIQLAQYAQSVIILVRKDRMRAAPTMQDRLKEYQNIQVIYNTQIQEIIGDGSMITTLTLWNNKEKTVSDMPLDRLFLAVGHVPNTDLFKPFVKMDAHGYIQVEGRTQKTSLPGVFVAGDNEDSVYRQAITASAAGVRAAIDADAFLTEIGLTPQVAANLEPQLFQVKKSAKEAAPVKTLGEFYEELDNNRLVVAYFYSPDCIDCNKMTVGFDAVSEQLGDQVRFIRINTDEATSLVEEFFVEKVPAILVFENGSLIAHYKNVMNEQDLRNFVARFMEQN